MKKFNKLFVIVNGFPRSGKDTFIQILSRQLERHKDTYTCISVSSIDLIKEIAKKNFEWDGAKDTKGRRLLSDLKDAASRYNNLPLKHIKTFLESEKKTHSNTCIFSCIREPVEIEKAVNMSEKLGFQPVTVFIDSPDHTGNAHSNHADTDVENYFYDITISNSGSLVDFDLAIASSFYSFCEDFNLKNKEVFA